ncbi:MAG: NAD-dependent epimerase/dehydratase family protein, partial [Deltaproteobacteria bacterium]|nr:NAD-dependent epimerase/dehydratase family protein [Deltaproteobacteria bacterium]
AAMNRHNDPQVIYDTNIRLVKQLISACEATKSTPHILFSSSTQEERDNPYGKSKREGRGLFEEWAKRIGSRFSGLVIPNIYGPFGNPYYNSVVATFCHQITHEETPKIDVDGELNLIYVGELVNEILSIIDSKEIPVNKNKFCEAIKIQHTATIKVSDLLGKLEGFKQDYFIKGIIPDLDNPFERNLFNTFVCYIDHETFFPFHLTLNTDERGSFVETVKLNSGGQISFSTTLPGITRGNHFHTRKAERFAVIKGKARIDIRKIGTDKVLSFNLDGRQPSFVDMPIWFTHNVTNIGDEELYIIFWVSEHYNENDPDTFIEKVGK